MKSQPNKLKDTGGNLGTAIVVVSLVQMLMHSLDEASDVYDKLKTRSKKNEKEVKELKQEHGFSGRHGRDDDSSRRSRSSRSRSRRRHSDYDDDSDSDAEPIAASSALVRREFDRFHRHIGERFAVGDIIAQNQLQAQIIIMQQTIISVFQESALFYGSAPPNPMARRLAIRLLEASRAARGNAIEALALQYQRMLSSASVPPAPPSTMEAKEVVYRSRPRSSSTTSTPSRPTAISERDPSPSLYCVYALDLQKYPAQALADSYKPGGDGRCPYCRYRIETKPGKAWQIVKEDPTDSEKDLIYLIENRFVVKAHREGGRFACPLCSSNKEADTTCKTVSELVEHVWLEHKCSEYEEDWDIVHVPG